MGINGEGIGVISGRLVFIPYALPGEEVLVEITENARNFSRAKLVKIIEKSPNRVKPQDRAYHEMSQSHIMHLFLSNAIGIQTGCYASSFGKIQTSRMA